MSESKDIADLPGVGEKIAEKLKQSGYVDMMAIAAASAAELGFSAEIGEATANKIINAARESLDIGFESALKVWERRETIGRITTGSKNLDDLLGGGVETVAVTEFHGAFGSSKTQVGHQLAVNVQRPVDQGGLEGNCIYIDTESTFRPERIKQMTAALEMDIDEVLQNIVVGRAYNSDHQMLLTEKAAEVVRERNIKLLVVDSVTSAFRADYMGRGQLAARQQKLNRHLHVLLKLAEVYNIAIYITNQVMARPNILFGDPTVPIGGHILGHFSTHRLYVRRSKANTRIARIVDSPNLPEGEAVFRIKEEGIRDP